MKSQRQYAAPVSSAPYSSKIAGTLDLGGEVLVTARDEAAYAAILRIAATQPELLTEDDRAKLLPEDVELIAKVIDHHIDELGVELTRRQREKRTGQSQPRHPAIASKRWAQILESIKAETFRYTDLSIDEILAIDNDAELHAQYAEALEAAG